jgi:hypothetical protein
MTSWLKFAAQQLVQALAMVAGRVVCRQPVEVSYE